MSANDTSDLVRRIAELQDIEAIRRLKHEYCRHCDNHYDGDSIASLFAEDGIWEASAPYVPIVGPAAIAEFFKRMPAAVSFCVHTVANDEITVSGNTATGRWRSVIPATVVIDGVGVPHWLFNDYEDTFRRIDGKWKFVHLKSIIYKSATHAIGWT
ncbi:MAG: nuclear transport factor 2 family protein [Dehalococcoidia bacterium]